MSKYADDATVASHPVGVTLRRDRLAGWPYLSFLDRITRWIWIDRFAERIDEYLRVGDSRAAVVIGCAPLRIGVYSDELDCVAVLAFPSAFVSRFGLTEGARLLAVNMYGQEKQIAWDLTPGPGVSGRWQNFYPLVAEFLSDDIERIAERKAKIAESEWTRCVALASSNQSGSVRDGSPFALFKPAIRSS